MELHGGQLACCDFGKIPGLAGVTRNVGLCPRTGACSSLRTAFGFSGRPSDPGDDGGSSVRPASPDSGPAKGSGLTASRNAGVVRYDMDFAARIVTYYGNYHGCKGEEYVEAYPAVEIGV